MDRPVQRRVNRLAVGVEAHPDDANERLNYVEIAVWTKCSTRCSTHSCERIGDSDGIGSFEGSRLKVVGLYVRGAERLAKAAGPET